MVQKGQLELGEFDWWSDMNVFGEQIGHEALTVAEVPQLPISLPTNHTIQYRPTKNSMPNKKPRIEFPRYDDDEYSIVPDLGWSLSITANKLSLVLCMYGYGCWMLQNMGRGH